MILDLKDAECLKLIGLCRYLPVSLGKKYGEQVVYAETTGNLLEHGLIKYTTDMKCLKLTCFGRGVLEDMGYIFTEDARTVNSGTKYIRRMMCAETNLLFHSAGINIFSEKSLSENNICYIPFLNMRSEKDGAVLACARFAGIFRNGDTAYIIYYVNNNDESGLHISFEEKTFEGLVRNIEGVSYTKIIFTGTTLEKLTKLLFVDSVPTRCIDNSEPFAKAFQKFAYNIHLLELNKNGALQARILASDNYRKKLADYFCKGRTELPPQLSYCDGFYNNNPLIIAVDMDLKRIYAAAKQAELYNKGEPYIIYLSFQDRAIKKFLKHNAIRKAQLISVTFEKIAKCLNLTPIEYTNEPVRNTKGGCMTVRCKS